MSRADELTERLRFHARLRYRRADATDALLREAADALVELSALVERESKGSETAADASVVAQELRRVLHDLETFVDQNCHTRAGEEATCPACSLVARSRSVMEKSGRFLAAARVSRPGEDTPEGSSSAPADASAPDGEEKPHMYDAPVIAARQRLVRDLLATANRRELWEGTTRPCRAAAELIMQTWPNCRPARPDHREGAQKEVVGLLRDERDEAPLPDRPSEQEILDARLALEANCIESGTGDTDHCSYCRAVQTVLSLAVAVDERDALAVTAVDLQNRLGEQEGHTAAAVARAGLLEEALATLGMPLDVAARHVEALRDTAYEADHRRNVAAVALNAIAEARAAARAALAVSPGRPAGTEAEA